jgi:hypothetical protein
MVHQTLDKPLLCRGKIPRWAHGHLGWPEKNMEQIDTWLVVSTPLKNISQLGLLFPIYGKITAVFQTTNRIQIDNSSSHCYRPPWKSELIPLYLVVVFCDSPRIGKQYIGNQAVFNTNTHYSRRNYFSAIFWSFNPDLASEFSSTLQGLQLSHLGYQPGTLTQHGAFGCFSAAACGGVTVSSAHHRINGDDGIYWDNFSRKIMRTIRGDISWGNHGILQRTIWGILTRYF